jgi:hypothetical protein
MNEAAENIGTALLGCSYFGAGKHFVSEWPVTTFMRRRFVVYVLEQDRCVYLLPGGRYATRMHSLGGR